jgi:shikimate dehydrogenase
LDICAIDSVRNNLVRQFGLIGYPLTHSFSQRYFTEKFLSESIADAAYELFPLANIQDLPELIDAHEQLVGLNVTIPHKESVIPLLDELDATAREIGAVNTIKIIRDTNKTRLIGFNTDVFGFLKSLKPFLTLHHDRALIIGTGGGAAAVAFGLKSLGIQVLFTGRKPNSVKQPYLPITHVSPELLKHYKLAVNTTPLGMFPHAEGFPDIPYSAMSGEHLVFDLVYNPESTAFMQKASDFGATALNGYDMLRYQAEKAWEIWNSSA